MRYLVDTDWVIDYLHRVSPIVGRILELSPDGIGLSIVSLAELYEGVFYSRDPVRNETGIDQFLDGVELIPIDDEICQIFASERGRLKHPAPGSVTSTS